MKVSLLAVAPPGALPLRLHADRRPFAGRARRYRECLGDQSSNWRRGARQFRAMSKPRRHAAYSHRERLHPNPAGPPSPPSRRATSGSVRQRGCRWLRSEAPSVTAEAAQCSHRRCALRSIISRSRNELPIVSDPPWGLVEWGVTGDLDAGSVSAAATSSGDCWPASERMSRSLIDRQRAELDRDKRAKRSRARPALRAIRANPRRSIVSLREIALSALPTTRRSCAILTSRSANGSTRSPRAHRSGARNARDLALRLLRVSRRDNRRYVARAIARGVSVGKRIAGFDFEPRRRPTLLDFFFAAQRPIV